MDDYDEVRRLLEADLENFENELGEVYDRVERYDRTADVLSDAGRESDAEYFRELALEEYKVFTDVIQLEKEAGVDW